MVVIGVKVVGVTSVADMLPNTRNSTSFVALASRSVSSITVLVMFDCGSKPNSKSTPTLPRKNLIKTMYRKKRNVLLKKGTRKTSSSRIRARDLAEFMSSYAGSYTLSLTVTTTKNRLGGLSKKMKISNTI